jgi:hypothetical protein
VTVAFSLTLMLTLGVVVKSSTAVVRDKVVNWGAVVSEFALDEVPLDVEVVAPDFSDAGFSVLVTVTEVSSLQDASNEAATIM